MRQAFHIRLHDLGERSTLMSRISSATLRDATAALLTTDLQLAQRVISAGAQLRQMRAHAESVGLELLALQAPVAADLRAVLCALWNVADLERMGELAIHVARAVPRRHPAPVVPPQAVDIFREMGQVGVQLADHAGQVLHTPDIALARLMESDDDLMDDLHQQLFTALLSPTWSHGVQIAVDLTLLGRYYERFADHAVAVARRVIFLINGVNVGGDTTPTSLTPPG